MKTAEEILGADPVCFWDFTSGLISKGRESYTLLEGGQEIPYATDGIFGDKCPEMMEGRYFTLPRATCPKLDFSSDRSEFTVVAWIKRHYKNIPECQAIAGMWNETDRKRQYCLFVDLHIWDSADQVAGHISSSGGPTDGYRYCMDAAIGESPIPLGEWQTLGFTYNGESARVYLEGVLDSRMLRNPFDYGKPLYKPDKDGADFTVGGVYRKGSMGNWFHGLLGGLAVFDRSLGEEYHRLFVPHQD